MNARHCVLVLGMHRSGTSMVSGLLMRAGLQAPRTALPPTEWNVEGYGESAILHTFHECLLQRAGTRWDAYTRVAPEWLASEAATEMGVECRDLLSREFDLARPFVLKDPRVCRLVPFWRIVFEAKELNLRLYWSFATRSGRRIAGRQGRPPPRSIAARMAPTPARCGVSLAEHDSHDCPVRPGAGELACDNRTTGTGARLP
jgi:hypothetical protein